MALLIYNITILVYSFFVRIAALFNPKAKLFVEGRKNILNEIADELNGENRPVIWMHCASLGEFEQGRPIIEAIRRLPVDYCIVLTFFSPSGYTVRKDYPLADHVFYLPLDKTSQARKFVRILKPKIALFVKYELWYHYLKTLNVEKIPVFLFSAFFQKEQIFFKTYGKLYREMLGFFEQIFVQDQSSKDLLKSIGIHQVQIAGDTRFDRSAEVVKKPVSFLSAKTFKGRKKLIVAGSTWPKDETFLKEALALLPDDYKLLIVPHEIEEANIHRILELFEGHACLWDAESDRLAKMRIAVVNKIGYLSYLYQYADVAWIGGGFAKSGIHNSIEAAVYGIPVFFGPHYKRFREAEEMIQCNAAQSVGSPHEFEAALRDGSDLSQKGENAKEYVSLQLGASRKIMDYLVEKYLPRTV